MQVLCTGFYKPFSRTDITVNTRTTDIRVLGEYVPGHINTLSLNRIKEFAAIPYHIEWYRGPDSRKVFPLFLQELSDLNPTSQRIPGLITRNPYFDHAQIKYLAAYRERKPVGRMAAFIDYNYREEGAGKIGWFGLFESEDDKNTADLLIDNALDYLKENGCEKIIGPAKFHAGGEIGLLVKGFENMPYFMEPYNAPYYRKFFEDHGFRKENDWYSVNIDSIISKTYMEKIARIFDRLLGHRRADRLNGYNIRNVDFSHLDREIGIIRELYNPIWNEGTHPQQVKMTDEEFRTLALGIKEIAMEELIFIVEKEGVPVGISVNLPDINEVISEMDGHAYHMPSNRFYSPRDILRDLRIFINIKKRLKKKDFSRMRFFILGVLEKHRKNGIDSKLFWEIKEKALGLGIYGGSASQLADINMDIINPIFRLGKTAMTWRVYSLKV
jgi:hypothetical protein